MNADRAGRSGLLRTLAPVVRIGIGLALVYWLIQTGAIDRRSFSAFAAAWPLVVAAELLILAALVATALRLVLLVGPAGLHMSIAGAIELTMIGGLFNFVLPGGAGGDVVRIWYATRGNAGRRAEVIAVLLFDRLVGMFALILFPLLVLPFFPSLFAAPPVKALAAGAGAMLAALLAVFAVVFSDRLRTSGLVRWAFARLPLGSVAERIVDTVRIYRRHPGSVIFAGVISLVAHGLSIGATIVLARILLGDGFNWAVFALIPLGFLANTVPLTPGGLGVGEAAFDRLFEMAGLTGGAVVLIGWRFLSLGPAALGLIVYLRGRRQFVAERAPSV